jgi:hypothetical protein
MPSPSALVALSAFDRAEIIRAAGPNVGTGNTRVRETVYHAALAVNVAAWDSYLNGVVKDFYNAIATTTDAKFQALHQVSRAQADQALKRFNTPNFEQSRELLVRCTGYDPYGFWSWQRKGLNILQVQGILNEFLQVRHSFAHGFPLPNTTWTVAAQGQVKLRARAVAGSQSLLRHLVRETDRGLKSHIAAAYGITRIWT